MKEQILEIFQLCNRLSILLGDKEVFNTIKEVVQTPEIIINNPKSNNKKDFISGKKGINI